MIIFFNSQGTAQLVLPAPVYQNSNAGGQIVVVAPFPTTTGVTVRFTLPNGAVTQSFVMTSVTNESADTIVPQGWNVWSLVIPIGDITKQIGTCAASFSFTYVAVGAVENQSAHYETITTGAVVFTVYGASEYTLPDSTMPAEQWEQFVAAFSRVAGRVTNIELLLPVLKTATYENGVITFTKTNGETLPLSLTDITTALSTLDGKIGNLSNLETTAKNNLVSAINEIYNNSESSISSKIGDLDDLTTTAKSNLVSAINEVDGDVAQLRADLTNAQFFKGYFETPEDLPETATEGDYAYVASNGKVYLYTSGAWTETEQTVPDQTVPKATTLPVMDGTATIGESNKYAAADHVHPHDTSKQDVLTFDTTPTANSTNPVTSGGVKTAISTLDGKIGDLNDLDTTNKDSAVDAINEVNNDLDALSTQKIGNLADLRTEHKTSIVGAINEANVANYKIGDLEDLNTYYKDTLVNAINEVNSEVDTKQDKLTQVTDLTPIMQIRSLTANTRYAFGELASLILTFPETASDGDKIIVEFKSEDTATTLAITNAIYDFTDVNPYCFVKFIATYSVSLSAWVIEKTETFDVDTTLENNSWGKIATICRLGLADKFWQVGDTKSLQMTFRGYTYTLHAQLVDLHKGRYEYTNKAGASNVVFQFVECLPARSPTLFPYDVDDYSINGSNTEDRTNAGGWAACRMRTFLNGTVFYQLPVELQNAIAEVYVSSGIGNQTTSGTSDSANKLFLASEYEVYGGTESQRFTLDNNLEHYSIGKSEGAPEFDYWKLHPTAEEHQKRPVNTDTYNYWWWLRSPRSGGSGQAWCSVRENGSPESVFTSGELQICPCFVLG